MKLFDLHCDTVCELARCGTSLASNGHHVALDKAAAFDNYVQTFAHFATYKATDEEGYQRFNLLYSSLLREIEKNKDKISLVKNAKELDAAISSNKAVAIPAVEDARILAGNISRIDELKDKGIWYLTLMWSGETTIGGSHDTSSPLTPFGKEVVERCFNIGIVPDISHASEQAVEDTVALAYDASSPIIASHSNSYSVYSHSRNLRDRHMEAIKELGGIIGISLCKFHLYDKAPDETDMTDVLRHIEYYLSRGMEDVLCIGADWDGTDLPKGFFDIRSAQNIYESLLKLNYSEELIEKIFFGNAYRFYKQNF